METVRLFPLYVRFSRVNFTISSATARLEHRRASGGIRVYGRDERGDGDGLRVQHGELCRARGVCGLPREGPRHRPVRLSSSSPCAPPISAPRLPDGQSMTRTAPPHMNNRTCLARTVSSSGHRSSCFDHIRRYPFNIPAGTAIPAWAYQDVAVSTTL